MPHALGLSAARRKTFIRTLVALCVTAVAATTGALSATSAGAATSTVVKITGLFPHLVPSTTANQVIMVAGSGFDESVISSVSVSGCTAPSYIVASDTILYIKTDNTCTAGANKVVTITDTSSNTAVSVPGAAGGVMALSFVVPPTIATASATVHPVITDNTAGMSYATQTSVGTTASTKGGTVIRVTSGAVGFSNTTALPLKATLDGVPLTKVTLVGTNGTAGNYFTGVVGAHVADAAPVLKITNNGVTSAFVWGAGGSGATAGTFDFAIGGSTITVSPAFGPAKGGNKLLISGSGFSTTGANDVVTVNGVSCPLTTPAPTATSIACTVPASTLAGVAGPVEVQVAVTGGLTSVISAGSTYTYLAQ